LLHLLAARERLAARSVKPPNEVQFQPGQRRADLMQRAALDEGAEIDRAASVAGGRSRLRPGFLGDFPRLLPHRFHRVRKMKIFPVPFRV